MAKLSLRDDLDSRHLSRYLDYCSELLAAIGKIAALYAQHLDDPVVLDSVSEVETLAAGLSAKIWQKLTILDARRSDIESGNRQRPRKQVD